MKKLAYLTGALVLSLSMACNRQAQWKVEGNVEGGDGNTVYLETSQGGTWMVLDSAVIADGGAFTISHDAPAAPSIYRLTYDGKVAYIPVDSVETLTFKAVGASFDKGYKVEGTTDAEMLTTANALIAGLGANQATNDSIKRLLGQQVLQRPSGPSAYYIINSTAADGTPIFSSTDKMDVKILGAVANAYSMDRPDDPRTKTLEQKYLSAKAAMMPESYLQAKADSLSSKIKGKGEVGYIEIELNDENGKPRKLSELVGKGPVILNFTDYSADYSPEINLALGELNKQYGSRGLQIYQIAFDADNFEWRRAARDIPWVTVHNPTTVGTDYLVRYNTGVPMSFIIDSRGDIVERVANPQDLAKTVGKYL